MYYKISLKSMKGYETDYNRTTTTVQKDQEVEKSFLLCTTIFMFVLNIELCCYFYVILKRYFSKRPHVPGTARSKELAEEIARTWKGYDFDKVEMPKYNVLLPYVNPNISNKVQILDTGNNTVLEFSGKEEVCFRFAVIIDNCHHLHC